MSLSSTNFPKIKLRELTISSTNPTVSLELHEGRDEQADKVAKQQAASKMGFFFTDDSKKQFHKT